MRYFHVVSTIFKDPSLLNPNIYLKALNDLDFQALHSLGIKYLVFDKDNTLTKTFSPNYYSPSIEATMKEALQIFGKENIGILSNSLKSFQKGELFQKEIHLIPYKKKKPCNFQDVLEYFPCKNNEEIAFIGDRLLTDVLLANANGALSIYIEPLERTHEYFNIKIMRFIEEKLLWKKLFKENREHHKYSRQDLNKIIKKNFVK